MVLSPAPAVLSAWWKNVIQECICDTSRECPAYQVKLLSGQLFCAVRWAKLVTAQFLNTAVLQAVGMENY